MICTPLPLFDIREAAHAQVQPTAQQTRARIMAYARQCGSRGLTADEVAVDFDCSHNHNSPRIGELVRAGELIITGRRRQTRSGCLARVFVAKQVAQQPVEDYRLFPDDAPPRHLDFG